jgi:hypothetical protein
VSSGFEHAPVAGAHVPAPWHGSIASQTTKLANPVHAPSQQISPLVHAFPSLHAVPFTFGAGAGHPVAGTHAATVWHWSAPVHVTAVPPVHAPAWHVSPFVQAFASLHVVPSALRAGQVPVVLSHAPAVWHCVSVEHAIAVPGVQTPA